MIDLQLIHFRRLLIFLIVIGLVAVAVLIPVSQRLRCVCRVESPVVWYLAKDGAGEISTGWERNLLAMGGKTSLFHFERPDFVEVTISPKLNHGAEVLQGDTLAIILSKEGIGRLEVLQAELQTARSNLEALKAGARAEDLEVARRNVERAQATFNSFSLEHDRVKALYDSNFISQSQYQVSKGSLDVFRTELALAEAEVNALKTGARPQDIKVAEDEVATLRSSIESARSALGSKEYIITPLKGRFYFGGAANYLFKVESSDTVALYIPLPESVVPKLNSKMNIEIVLDADPLGQRNCRLFTTGFLDTTFRGAYAVSLLENSDGLLKSGMTGKAIVPIGKTTLLEGLKARLSSFDFRR